MKIYFGQIYAEVGASFPFTFHLQHRLSEEVISSVRTSDEFSKKFGDDWNLMFRISAKTKINATEIRGPTVFRKSKDVEFSVFLPFDKLRDEANIERAALVMLLSAVCEVLDRYEISTEDLRAKINGLVEGICTDPSMFQASRVQ